MASPTVTTVLERLILAQVVYELGTDSWPDVATLLSKNPLISLTFSAESCKAAYDALITEAGLQRRFGTAAWQVPALRYCLHSAHPLQGQNSLKLAQRLYQARVSEIQGQILEEEAKFKKIAFEIDQIRSGSWDDKIRERLGISDDVQQEPAVESAPNPEAEEPSSKADELSSQVEEPEPPTDSVVAAEPSPPGPRIQSPLLPVNEVEVRQDEEGVISVDDAIEKEPTPAPPALDELEVPSDVQHIDTEVPEGPKTPEAPEEKSETPVTQEPNPVEPTVESEQQPTVDEPPITPPDESPKVTDEKPEDAVSPSKTSEHDVSGELEPVAVTPTQVTSREGSTGEQDIVMSEPTPVAEPEEVNSPVVEPEPASRDYKRKASELEGILSDSERDKKKMREDSQPIEEEDAAPSPGPSRRRGGRQHVEVTPASKKFQSVIIMLHSQISQHRNGNIFHNPIKNSEAPDYREIVKRPMDLKTIKMRIKDNTISNSAEFQRDVYLMFANSMMYNRPKSDIYNMAEEMMLESESQINTFRQTEGIIRGGHRL
ncbi:hypothetical protein EVG20_g2845 [Dentipellis fragilis]|uniref:Bromo domain-containing protein n=1 Tax=Dentipellis fragilis TaxID=205917 RepID=A0A4Y9Z7Z4_9AGAM|nr:hypothetical protein EVG20_g2845 [Dentipellis fragilis]